MNGYFQKQLRTGFVEHNNGRARRCSMVAVTVVELSRPVTCRRLNPRWPTLTVKLVVAGASGAHTLRQDPGAVPPDIPKHPNNDENPHHDNNTGHRISLPSLHPRRLATTGAPARKFPRRSWISCFPVLISLQATGGHELVERTSPRQHGRATRPGRHQVPEISRRKNLPRNHISRCGVFHPSVLQ